MRFMATAALLSAVFAQDGKVYGDVTQLHAGLPAGTKICDINICDAPEDRPQTGFVMRLGLDAPQNWDLNPEAYTTGDELQDRAVRSVYNFEVLPGGVVGLQIEQ